LGENYQKELDNLISGYSKNQNNKISGWAFQDFVRMLNELNDRYKESCAQYNNNIKTK
jgi:hypothetical protein